MLEKQVCSILHEMPEKIFFENHLMSNYQISGVSQRTYFLECFETFLNFWACLVLLSYSAISSVAGLPGVKMLTHLKFEG